MAADTVPVAYKRRISVNRSLAGVISVTDDKVGKYRLLRQIHGRGAFGEVHVVVRPAQTGAESRVIWAVDDADMSSTQPDTDPLDASTALDGALQGLVLAESWRARKEPGCPRDVCRD